MNDIEIVIDPVDLTNLAVGGTYNFTYRHGVSDDLPYNAPAGDAIAATRQAVLRDEEITAQHRADPELAKACHICNPPKPLPAPFHLQRRTWRWWSRRILWGVHGRS